MKGIKLILWVFCIVHVHVAILTIDLHTIILETVCTCALMYSVIH